jgi:hypothetical protein
MLAQYLRRQAAAEGAGLGPAEAGGEVVPFEAAPTQPVEPRLAWSASLEASRFYGSSAPTLAALVPPDWANLVADQAAAMAVPFCVGNFPQRVRSLAPFLDASRLARLLPADDRPATAPDLVEWVEQRVRTAEPAQALLAVGVLRLARRFEAAENLLRDRRGQVRAAWRAAWDNEQGAVAWERGRADEALSLWGKAGDSAPVLFNRGLAALFHDRPEEARPWLTRAVGQLPDEGPWHHLARFYLGLAEMRG